MFGALCFSVIYLTFSQSPVAREGALGHAVYSERQSDDQATNRKGVPSEKCASIGLSFFFSVCVSKFIVSPHFCGKRSFCLRGWTTNPTQHWSMHCARLFKLTSRVLLLRLSTSLYCRIEPNRIGARTTWTWRSLDLHTFREYTKIWPRLRHVVMDRLIHLTLANKSLATWRVHKDDEQSMYDGGSTQSRKTLIYNVLGQSTTRHPPPDPLSQSIARSR